MGQLNENYLQLQNNLQAIDRLRMRTKQRPQTEQSRPTPVNPEIVKAEKQDRKKINATLDSINDLAFGKPEPKPTKGADSVIQGLGAAFK
jgi:hypothetical protein